MNDLRSDAQANPDRWFVLLLACIGTFMGTLDISIVTVAMPTLTNVLKTTPDTSKWFVLAYTFVITILLLTFGKVGDLIGRKRLYTIGIGIFIAGSLACGLAISAATLILARALQGIGSAMTMSAGPALITQAFPARERGKALGLIGSSVAAGLVTGPVIGGLILQHANWRWMFFLNLPIGAVLLYLFQTRVHDMDERKDRRLDILGAVLTALALGALLTALDFGNDFGWLSVRTLTLFALAAIFAVAFFKQEKRAAEPILDFRLFRHREFSVGAAAGWANYAASAPISVFIPFYLENLLRFEPQKVGLILAAGPLSLAFVAPMAGALSDRIGSRLLTSLGLVIAGVGILSLRSLTPTSSAFDIAWRLMLTGCGSGIFVPPNSSSVMGSVKETDLGIASGTVALMRNLGMVCGIALAGAIIAGVGKGYAVTGIAAQHLAFFHGLRAAFLAAGLISLAGAVVSTLRVRK